jgi:hypothetical protein
LEGGQATPKKTIPSIDAMDIALFPSTLPVTEVCSSFRWIMVIPLSIGKRADLD